MKKPPSIYKWEDEREIETYAFPKGRKVLNPHRRFISYREKGNEERGKGRGFQFSRGKEEEIEIYKKMRSRCRGEEVAREKTVLSR